jgi:2-keto-4-pentenoate hydratase/2-oxohepta-3-ene-1,7-dioic acid hydratase in catechol pathway
MFIKLDNEQFNCSRVFCIGRNYVEHIEELGNERPESPVIFSKPPTSLVAPGEAIRFPRCGETPHFETELVVLIGKKGVPKNREDAASFVAGLTVGYDLTLRETQNRLIEKSLPWDICKGFDDSAPVGEFTRFDGTADDLAKLTFSGSINGVLRQSGNTAKMIFPIPELLIAISRYWELVPGDLIYTGTPPGVGKLTPGAILEATDHTGRSFSWNLLNA